MLKIIIGTGLLLVAMGCNTFASLEDAAEPDMGTYDQGTNDEGTNDQGVNIDQSVDLCDVSCGIEHIPADVDLIFVTKTRYFVQDIIDAIEAPDGDIRQRADKLCTDEANDFLPSQFAQLKWKAILSRDSSTDNPDAEARNYIANRYPVWTHEGNEFADAGSLFSSPTKSTFSTSVTGEPFTGTVRVWTGAKMDGGDATTCYSWVRADNTTTGAVGNPRSNTNWLNDSENQMAALCDEQHYLYCISQLP